MYIEYERRYLIRRVVNGRRKVKRGEVEEGLGKVEKEELEELENEIEVLEEEESELEQMEEEVEEQKQGLLSSLFSKINVFKGRQGRSVDIDSYEEEVPPPELDEDVKDVLRIAHQWLERLPPKHRRAFKESKDFESYKSILLKYGLVKET